MKLHELAAFSAQVTCDSGRLAKIGHLAECLRRLEPAEIPIAVAYLCGELPQGKVGIGWSMLKDALACAPSEGGVLTLADADACFENVRRTTGSGSNARRTEILTRLLGRASETEREFLQRLVMGEMRHGRPGGGRDGSGGQGVGTAVPLPPAGLLRQRLHRAGGLGCRWSGEKPAWAVSN